MKVILAIDAIRYPLTGIGRYTYELARGLAAECSIESLLFLQGAAVRDTLPEDDGSRAGDGEKRRGVLRRTLLKSRTVVTAYRMATGLSRRRALAPYTDYIFHGPNFYLPSFGGRSVVTMHDLSPFTWSHCHPPERVRFMHAEIALSLKRASLLITDSEFTRREMAEYFNWPLDRIRAVSLASAEEFHPREELAVSVLLGEYGLRYGEYAFYAGTIEPRKNISVLLDAYEMLPESLRRRCPLILAGYKGWNSDKLHARIEAATRAGWARYLGFLPADHLPVLFAGARLFAFPSLYEGFGLPVLEAMASGVPVVCSNSSSLPEVAGDAAAMCEPADVDGLRELLRRGLEDEDWRATVRQKGLTQAGRFSWARCARETGDAYRAVGA